MKTLANRLLFASKILLAKDYNTMEDLMNVELSPIVNKLFDTIDVVLKNFDKVQIAADSYAHLLANIHDHTKNDIVHGIPVETARHIKQVLNALISDLHTKVSAVVGQTFKENDDHITKENVTNVYMYYVEQELLSYFIRELEKLKPQCDAFVNSTSKNVRHYNYVSAGRHDLDVKALLKVISAASSKDPTKVITELNNDALAEAKTLHSAVTKEDSFTYVKADMLNEYDTKDVKGLKHTITYVALSLMVSDLDIAIRKLKQAISSISLIPAKKEQEALNDRSQADQGYNYY